MEEIPPRDGEEEDFSIWVIVYDESDSSYYYNIGFYDYEDQVWTAFTDEPMLFKMLVFCSRPISFLG